MMSLLYEKNLKMLPKTADIILPFNRQNISATQHKLQFDTGVAMQNNAKQYLWYSIILVANTIPNTGKFAKTVHLDSFREEPSSLRLSK